MNSTSKIWYLNNSLAYCLQKRITKHKMPPTHKIFNSNRSKHVGFFLHKSEESYKKIKLKEICVAVIVVAQPIGCARGGRCCDPRPRTHLRTR